MVRTEQTVDQILATLAAIGRPNFGVTYEPANLMLAGEQYGQEALHRLSPHLFNIYIQNHRFLRADEPAPAHRPYHYQSLGGSVEAGLDVPYENLLLWEEGGVDTRVVFDGLRAIGWQGVFTIHQAQGIETIEEAEAYAQRCARFVRQQSANL